MPSLAVWCARSEASWHDESVKDKRNVPTHCDWCYRPLSAASIKESKSLGLDAEHSWCCKKCLTSGAYRSPPQGWDGTPSEWPFREA